MFDWDAKKNKLSKNHGIPITKMTNMLIFPLLFSSFFFSFGLRALKWCAARHVTPNEHRELHWWKTAQNHTKRAFAHVFISKMTVKKSNLSKSRKKVFDGSFEGAELPCVIIFAWFRIHLAVACETFSINRLFSHGRLKLVWWCQKWRLP